MTYVTLRCPVWQARAMLRSRTAMRPVGGVRPPMSTREGVRGRRWQVMAIGEARPSVTSWASPRAAPRQAGDKELEPPEADRALETMGAGTDNGPATMDRGVMSV
ncbi:hypothetical protein GCM10009787_42870 [Streptomyces bangladeshensis]|uniref:Uncharacterized protein n=1 Tax=Streptomyces bangladeshensis TaxID=295352 RepID=A0ABN3BPD9_9ACTN